MPRVEKNSGVTNRRLTFGSSPGAEAAAPPRTGQIPPFISIGTKLAYAARVTPGSARTSSRTRRYRSARRSTRP
jgi:hypothetical protein